MFSSAPHHNSNIGNYDSLPFSHTTWLQIICAILGYYIIYLNKKKQTVYAAMTFHIYEKKNPYLKILFIENSEERERNSCMLRKLGA
jgi:hypothetical protein